MMGWRGLDTILRTTSWVGEVGRSRGLFISSFISSVGGGQITADARPNAARTQAGRLHNVGRLPLNMVIPRDERGFQQGP